MLRYTASGYLQPPEFGWTGQSSGGKHEIQVRSCDTGALSPGHSPQGEEGPGGKGGDAGKTMRIM